MITQDLLNKISNKIEEKRSIYISLIKSTYSHVKASSDEKEDFASDIFTSEREAFVERIKDYVNKNSKDKQQQPTLTEFQGVNIFLEVMQMGLSFAPAAEHIYLSRLKGTGYSIGYQITSKGVVFLAVKAGAIDHVSEVVIVKNSDEFSLSNVNNEFIINHGIDFSTSSFDYNKDFKLGYVYVYYPGDYKELKWVDKTIMDKAYNLSVGKNNYNNPSFLKSKIIARALKFENKVNFMLNSMGSVSEDLEIVGYETKQGLISEDPDNDLVIEEELFIPKSEEVIDSTESNDIQKYNQQPSTDLFGDLNLDF